VRIGANIRSGLLRFVQKLRASVLLGYCDRIPCAEGECPIVDRGVQFVEAVPEKIVEEVQ
jgi:hypothetical protein